jgi:hypothetical protein
MVTVDELKIIITADNKKFTKALAKTQKDLKGLQKQTKNTKKEGSKSFIDLQNVAESALGFGIANAAAVATTALIQFGKDSFAAFIKGEQAMQSFNLVVGKGADQLLQDLKKASNGMVGTVDTLAAANRAMALGLTKSNLPELMKIATARAKIMGITATQAFNDISIGIGRNSKLILDNLGIIIDLEEAQKKVAQSGMTLTQAIEDQIISRNQALVAAMDLLEETTAEKIAKLQTSWEEFKLTVGNTAGTVIDENEQMRESFIAMWTGAAIPQHVIADQVELASTLVGTEDALFKAQKASDAFRSSILGLVPSALISGEAEKDVELAEARNKIDEETLFLRNKIAEQKEAGIATNAEDEMHQTAMSELIAAQKIKVDELRTSFDTLRLQKKIEFDNFRDTEAKKGLVLVEQVKKQAKTSAEIIAHRDAEITKWKEEIKKVKDLKVAITDLGKESEKLQGIVTALGFGARVAFAIKGLIGASTGFTPGAGAKQPEQDFVQRPGQAPTSFSPNDTIIGVKDPASLGGGGGITVNIDNVSGVDADAIAVALRETLGDLSGV